MAWKSMTGYGSAERERDGRTWSVEVRSVNNRFLDAKVKLPRDYVSFEEPIRRRIAEFHQRGRVDLTLTVGGVSARPVVIRVDRELAKRYQEALAILAETTGITGEIQLLQFANLPDILVREQCADDLEAIAGDIDQVVVTALQACRDMRQTEARHLQNDLRERLLSFTGVVRSIEQQLPLLLRQRQDGLQQRLERLLDGVELDPVRLAQEVAILADKTDITEELVRLASHIGQFETLLDASEPVGRTLDFLIQELLREVNTVGSKISDAGIAHQVIALKSELEKMREQIQNIE